MILQKDLVQAFCHLSSKLDPSNQDLGDAINQTFSNNSWLTPENYWKSINHWKSSLNKENIEDFIAKHSIAINPRIVNYYPRYKLHAPGKFTGSIAYVFTVS